MVLIIAPLGQAEPAPYTCGICGFVMHEVGESHGEAARCPRCELMVEGTMEEANGGGEGFLQEVREIMDRADRAQRSSKA